MAITINVDKVKFRDQNGNYQSPVVLQGAKGDTGLQGPKGDPGDDYTLTAQDKSDIAGLVEADLAPVITNAEAATTAANTAAQNANNATGYIAVTEASSTASAAHAKGSYLIYDGNLYQATADIAIGDSLATTGTGANIAQVTGGAMGEVTDLKSATGALETRVSAIEEAEGLMRYGVSGIGQSASALTRIWDSVGMTAQVGTDGDNSNVINDFDHVTPFNRRKCVGQWHLVDGRPQFSVHAYYGDENYAEDGSMGDYVAVECPKAYFYLKDGVLGVSAHHYPGWKVFDIFTHGHNVDETFDYAYLPAYALAVKDGHAVSLPGLTNEQGTYKDLLDKARTYADADVGAKAILEPAAVAFYEWALQTVEFAQQNIKTVMYGCLSLRSSNDDTVVFTDATHILTNNYYASRVVGEAICVYGGTANHTNVAYQATHTIKSIIRCDETGTESASGTHQLIEVEDLGKNYFTYEIGTTYNLAARPWLTGACNGVSTPSGSPVSNTNGYYPMKYRWRENTHGNQYHTWADLFNKRVQDENSQDYLEWYYLPDPAAYETATTSKPDATDLATSAFEKLDVETAPEDYVNGYIKTRQYAEEYPEIWIPGTVTGASNTTYYAVYAYLVPSFVVRACRFGGSWTAGYVALSAYYAPAFGLAAFGGDLCYAQ